MNQGAYEAGALAFRTGVCYELNPHVPGGPDVAEKCRVMDWPVEAQQWHRGWRETATAKADAAEKMRRAAS